MAPSISESLEAELHYHMQIKAAEMQAPPRERLFLKTCFGFANGPYSTNWHSSAAATAERLLFATFPKIAEDMDYGMVKQL